VPRLFLFLCHNRFFHILWFIHFKNNGDDPDRNRKDYDTLWKLRRVFDCVNARFTNVYNPTEHLALDEVTAEFKVVRWFSASLLKRKGNDSA
jgi:hypothetical protein